MKHMLASGLISFRVISANGSDSPAVHDGKMSKLEEAVKASDAKGVCDARHGLREPRCHSAWVTTDTMHPAYVFIIDAGR
jgi:hypothetical protein